MNRMRSDSLVLRGSFLAAILLGASAAACSGGPGSFNDGDASTDEDAQAGDDGGATNDGTSPQKDGSTSKDGASSGQDSSTAQDAGTTQDAGGQIQADSSDGFGAARTACINEINKLRATENHKAYKLWETAAIDTCVDEQATYDQKANSAHDAWINNKYPTCNGNAQDECLGYGNSPTEIVACLDAMWNEKNQSNCAGCAACNGPTLTQTIINCQSTKTCDFYGNYGSECGHYLNMSADYFTEAACGFSTVGTSQDWATQNFQ